MKRIGGKDVAAMILAGEYERLYDQFSDELKNIVKLEEFRLTGQYFVPLSDLEPIRGDIVSGTINEQ